VDNNRGVRRDASRGINPLQLCCKPFTKYRNTITFHIREIGTWLRLGIVDKSVKINNGDVSVFIDFINVHLQLIGDQEDCFNIGYCRSGSISVCNSTCCIIKDLHARLEAGNFLSIRWDSQKKVFVFSVNNVIRKIVGVDVDKVPVEGHLYPAAQISWHTDISIVQPDFMELEGE
jgi:hypothetical protein